MNSVLLNNSSKNLDKKCIMVSTKILSSMFSVRMREERMSRGRSLSFNNQMKQKWTKTSDVTFDTEDSKLVSKKRNISHRSAVSELDSFCQKHVIHDVWSFIHLNTTWLIQYLLQTKRTTAQFPLHYNAFALFYFYSNLYIKVKWTLPMK